MHHVFKRNDAKLYPVALVIKESAFTPDFISSHYYEPLIAGGMPEEDFLAYSLKYSSTNKAPVKLIREHLDKMLRDLRTVQCFTIICADSAYFKTLTGLKKSEPHHGYITPCNIKGYEDMNVILSVNYQAIFHNPAMQDKLDMSIKTTLNHIAGTHVDLGTGIIHSAKYFHNHTYGEYNDIKEALKEMLELPEISCDIETFSLKINKAGIGTIAFAWGHHNGIAFPVDYVLRRYPIMKNIGKDKHVTLFGDQIHNEELRKILYDFFTEYKGKITYHNGTFDIKVLIYNLFMSRPLDYTGLLEGLNVMCRNIDDSKLIAYLATNTTAGNDLKLKNLAFEFAGNYAQDDIKDIRRIPLDELLEYNLIDCLCTNYVKDKYYPIMVQDQQLSLYEEMFIPGTKMIIHTEITGMPMDMFKVNILEQELVTDLGKHSNHLAQSPIIKQYVWDKQRIAMIDANLLLKKKVKPIEDFYEPFNPNSGNQIGDLLHKTLDFEIVDTTDTGLPATGAKTLQKHLNKLMREFDIKEEELL